MTSRATIEILNDKEQSKIKVEDENDMVVLMQLDDGTWDVAVAGISFEEDTEEGRSLPTPISTDTKSHLSPNDLLWQHAEHLDPAIHDQLQVLGCWDDTSRLLLTPHGFALECSPTQFDAVQAILEHQLAAVQEARAIQWQLWTAAMIGGGAGSTGHSVAALDSSHDDGTGSTNEWYAAKIMRVQYEN